MDSSGSYRSPGVQSACATSAVALVGLMSLAGAIVDAYGLSLVVPLAAGDANGLEAYFAAKALVGFVQLLLIVIAGISFSLWFYRANRNVTSFAGAGMRQSAGWAVGSIFVPIANLYIPARAAKDVWNACTFTVEAMTPGHAQRWRNAPLPFPISLWWGAWLTAVVLNLVGEAAQSTAADVHSFATGFALRISSGAMAAIAAGACVWVIWSLTRIQREVFESPGAEDDGGAPAQSVLAAAA